MGKGVLNIATVFADTGRLYVDSAPLIYYVEENMRYVHILDQLFEQTSARAIALYSSTITLAEVLVGPLKTGDLARVKEYLEVLEYSGRYSLRPVSSEIAHSAAELRAQYNLRTPDAVHVATAKDAECDAFLTNDNAFKRVTDLRVLTLNELTL